MLIFFTIIDCSALTGLERERRDIFRRCLALLLFWKKSRNYSQIKCPNRTKIIF
uniref:Uncharacterized protein n=1 Tax=Heterorhabditis bacteriophora TaxID=37862 RepID=A0A1I7WFY8_HETBA